MRRALLLLTTSCHLAAVSSGCESDGISGAHRILQEHPGPRLAVERRQLAAPLTLVSPTSARYQLELTGKSGSTQLAPAAVQAKIRVRPQQVATLRGVIWGELDSPLLIRTAAPHQHRTGSPGDNLRPRLRYEITDVLEATAPSLHLAKTRHQPTKAMPQPSEERPHPRGNSQPRQAELQVTVRGQLELNGIRREETTTLSLQFPMDERGPRLGELRLASVRAMSLRLVDYGLSARSQDEQAAASSTLANSFPEPASPYERLRVSLSFRLLATEQQLLESRR